MQKVTRVILFTLSLTFIMNLILPAVAVIEQQESETDFVHMLQRAEALINYEWIPSQRIYTWNGNEYNGKKYFEAGETVKGVPYTLFSWELGFDGLLSLEQYKSKSSINYSTERYCNSVLADRIGPAYGNCCATFVSEVFGGSFMDGVNPKYDGVGAVQKSAYSTTYRNVKVSAIQPGDALSCTSGAHIVWVGGVTDDSITIYESTPPVCQKVILNKSVNTDGNGYLLYNGNVYNIVTKSNEMIRNDLSSVASLTYDIPMPIHAYTKINEKTPVYAAINGNVKNNKIYGTDLCFIDAVFDNGWCHVNFTLDAGGMDHGYVKTSVFFDGKNIFFDEIGASIPVCSRGDLSESIGKVSAKSKIYFVGENEDAAQIIFPVSTGGYKLGWVDKEALKKTEEEVFLNQFCPIKGYPCVTENFEVKKNDYITRNGEIYTTDYCTINEIYSDGWCQVTFPLDSGGERTAYTPISNFIYDIGYSVYSYVTTDQIDVYTKKDLAVHNNWWTGIGDTVYIVGEYMDALQIYYPIDNAYGGGYKLGWIPRSAILSHPDRTIENISINSLPINTKYNIGDKIDLSGLEICLNYSDNTTEIVYDGFEISGFDSATPGIKTVTVYYNGKTTSFEVSVISVPDVLPKYQLSTASGRIGSNVEVYVIISDNPGIISLRNQIRYDTDALELISVSDTGLLRGFNIPSSQMNSPYTLRWVDSLANENNILNGSVAKLTFKIKETAVVGTYDITVIPVEARNINGDKIDFLTASTVVNVISYITGDADDDGEVSDWDAIVLSRYLAGWNVNVDPLASDIDNDGEISDWDVIILERYLAGWNVLWK